MLISFRRFLRLVQIHKKCNVYAPKHEINLKYYYSIMIYDNDVESQIIRKSVDRIRFFKFFWRPEQFTKEPFFHFLYLSAWVKMKGSK